MSATTTENGKTFFDNALDAQKKAFDTMKTTTEEFTKKFGKVANPLDANTEFFQKWYDEQMSFFNQAGKAGLNGSTEGYQELFTNWMNTQMSLFKSFVENSQKTAQENMNGVNGFSNPFANNMFSNNPLTNNMFSNNPFANNMFSNNPFANQTSGMNPLWNQWMNSMTESINGLSKGFMSGDAKQAFEGMMDNTNGFMKFYEMWSPMLKSINDKTYSNEMFAKMFNVEQYKTMMDQMFSMSPEGMTGMMAEGQKLMTQWMNNPMEGMKENWSKMSNQFGQFMPAMGNGSFQNILDQYNAFSKNMQEASSPLMKMMTPGTKRDQLETMNRISDLMVTYNAKNAELSHLIYNTGVKVFEKLGTQLSDKMKAGTTEPINMMAAYQEWMNLNDSVFTGLFDTDEFSKIQSELASAGMRLKKEFELQMEKVLENVPVITRSEMDELYKTVYELKKRIRTLEKEQENAVEEETPVAEVKASAPAKPAAKKTNK
jgi:class III poly(R)-hydroxyalkanoic acid synthase PhaE subunit